MPETEKTYVQALARHLRLLILVDGNISEDVLRQVMQANLHIWGGRYNPIVPAFNGTITQDWLNMIKDFDPDVVYYSTRISVQVLKDIAFFNPKEYIPFDEDQRVHFEGLNIHNLLHPNVYDRFTAPKTKLLHYMGRPDMVMTAKEFYRLNFGFMPAYVGEDRMTEKYELVGIGEEAAQKMNDIIFDWKPYFKTNLSALHVSSMRLIPQQYQDTDRFQWIVYESSNYLPNLLYFWNRQLYIKPQNRLSQVVVSTSEMDELLGDPNFGKLAFYLSHTKPTYLVSIDMSAENLETVRKRTQTACPHQTIFVDRIPKFPFPVARIEALKSSFLQPTKSLVIGKSDFIRLPSLTFESGDPIDDGPYAVDIRVEKGHGNDRTELKFPIGASIHHLALQGPTRVTRRRHIMLFTSKRDQTVEFTVPDDLEIIRSALHYREKERNLLQLPMEYTETSSAGQKLMAFFKLFDSDWATLRGYIEEKFWLQLFRYDSVLPKSPIKSGKGVFSYQDLHKELAETTQKYRPEIVERLRERAEEIIDDEFVDRIIERDIKDAFQFYIDPGIDYLIKRGGLLMGMKVKCDVCASNRWYSLTELGEKIPCKGCNNMVMPNLSSKVYYKVSDILINNLLSDQTKNSKQYDGNYVVLKTLIYLKEVYKGSGQSFSWCGPLGYRTQHLPNNWSSDFDIAALLNGYLILGEAKCQPTEFRDLEIDRLIWAANNLYPDKIIVSCLSGNLDSVAHKIREGVTNPACEVISYNVSGPWYQFPPLFGI